MEKVDTSASTLLCCALALIAPYRCRHHGFCREQKVEQRRAWNSDFLAPLTRCSTSIASIELCRLFITGRAGPGRQMECFSAYSLFSICLGPIGYPYSSSQTCHFPIKVASASSVTFQAAIYLVRSQYFLSGAGTVAKTPGARDVYPRWHVHDNT